MLWLYFFQLIFFLYVILKIYFLKYSCFVTNTLYFTTVINLNFMRPAQKWISDYVVHMYGNLAAPVLADWFQNYPWKNNICTLAFASFDIIRIYLLRWKYHQNMYLYYSNELAKDSVQEDTAENV